MLSPESIQQHLDSLLKPPGSLGRLEHLAARLASIQQTLRIESTPRRLVLFGADHGVVAEGVSAWPSEVTHAIIGAALSGQSACAALASSTNTELRIIDVGTLSAGYGERPGYRYVPVRAGSRNLARESAMTVAEWQQAWAIGAQEADRAAESGVKVVLGGEMGIGNTTPAACLAMLLANVPLSEAVGRGAGADDATLERKRRVVAAAVERARTLMTTDPITALASVAGYEIIALAGFYQRAAERRLTIVLDGFITTAALLIAARLHPPTTEHVIAAHTSAEPGHAAMLRALGLTPLLSDWQLRLGEGTGALLVLPMLDAAVAMMCQMGTLGQLEPPR